MIIREALFWAKNELEKKQVEGPKASAEFLLRQVLGVDRSYLISNSEKNLLPNQEKRFQTWINRRSKHEPVWYITGKIEFYGQDLFVNEHVLIPRPETEIILEKILKDQTGNKGLEVLDIGTGSGTMILTLAKYLPGNYFFASDFSEEALKMAKKNAKNLGLKVIFKKGDLFGPWVGQKFDLITANLPYVPHEEMETLAYDLIHYEPRLALDGGLKGLEVYERFFNELPAFTKPNSKIYCEIGDKQGEAIKDMAKRAFPDGKVILVSDYAEHDRLVIIER